MKLRILYHGNCFDGVSSAAIFTKFYLDKIHPDAEVSYTPTMHRAGNAFERDQFDGFVGWLVFGWTVLMGVFLVRLYSKRSAQAPQRD